MTLAIGYFLPNFMASGISFSSLRRLAQAVDQQTRFSDVWVGDHLVTAKLLRSRHPHFGSGFPPGEPFPFESVGLGGMSPDDVVLEPLTLLAYLAAVTHRVRLGLGVLVVPLRNPVLTAKMLSGIDLASDGRLTLAIGTGWMREEFDALGAEWTGRGNRTEDYVGCMRHLWSSSTAEFRSSSVGVSSNTCLFPKPLQAGGIPIWVGGNGQRALERAARIGDGWHGAQLSPEQAGAAARSLQELREQYGRFDDPFITSIRLTCWLSSSTPSASDVLVGSRDQVVEQLGRYREQGIQHVQMAPPPMKRVEAILDQVMELDELLQTIVGNGRAAAGADPLPPVDRGAGSGRWGRWGSDDETGALNMIGTSQVQAGAALVRAGRVLRLGQDLGPHTPTSRHRKKPERFMTRDGGDYAAGARRPGGFQFAEDVVSFAAHTATHIDSLAHAWYGDKLYNGYPASGIRSTTGAQRCGAEKLRPIATRGVLLDLSDGGRLARPGKAFGAEDVMRAAAAVKVTLQAGDAVLLHTGWMATAGTDESRYFSAEPGIDMSAARWLADAGVAVVGADNYAVEVQPSNSDATFPVHQFLIRDAGIPLIENLILSELAESGRSTFFFVAAPLPLVGSTAGPVNPIAVL